MHQKQKPGLITKTTGQSISFQNDLILVGSKHKAQKSIDLYVLIVLHVICPASARGVISRCPTSIFSTVFWRFSQFSNLKLLHATNAKLLACWCMLQLFKTCLQKLSVLIYYKIPNGNKFYQVHRKLW